MSAGWSPLALLALVGAALLPYAVLIARHLRRVLLGAILLDVVLQWDVNFGYRTEAGKLGAEAGLNISLTTFALAGLYGLWALERTRPHNDGARLRLWSARPLLVYVGISALSVWVARDPVLGGYMVALLVQTLLLFIYIVSTVRTRAEVIFVMTMLMAALLLEGALMLIMQLTGLSFSLLGLDTTAWEDAGMGEYARAAGTLGSPNTAAGVLELLVPAALALLAVEVGRPVRVLAGAALVVGLLALVSTGSRGGWAALVVSFAVLGFVGIRQGLIRPRTAAIAALATVVLLLPVVGMIVDRVVNETPGAAYSRIPLARIAWNMIQANPLLGVGLNNFVPNIPEYAGPEFSREWIYNVHNKYLLVASEAGIPALIAFLWFLAATVRNGVRCLGSSDPLFAALGAGLAAGVVGQMVHMNTDIFAGRASVQALWVMAALLAVLAALARAHGREETHASVAGTARGTGPWHS